MAIEGQRGKLSTSLWVEVHDLREGGPDPNGNSEGVGSTPPSHQILSVEFHDRERFQTASLYDLPRFTDCKARLFVALRNRAETSWAC